MNQSIEPAAGPGRIRQLNRRAVLAHIRRGGPTSRSALAPALSLSPAAVSSVVNELVDAGLLRESATAPVGGRLGRPISLLELDPSAAYALGVVLRPSGGAVRIDTAWTDYTGRVSARTGTQSQDAGSVRRILDMVVRAIDSLASSIPDPARIAGVTVGMPGVVEQRSMAVAPQLRVVEGDAFIAELARAVSHPLSFQNDVNLAALSELHRQPRLRNKSFAYLYLGPGIGAGIALHGEILSGGGWAGEIGQLKITRGRGKRQTFEALLGVDAALADGLEALGLPRAGYDALAAAVDEQDRRALRVVNRYSEHLCDVIQVLNAVLGLDEVLVDFPSEELFRRLRPRVETVMQDSALSVAVSAPIMGSGAAVHGAALSALEQALETIERRGER